MVITIVNDNTPLSSTILRGDVEDTLNSVRRMTRDIVSSLNTGSYVPGWWTSWLKWDYYRRWYRRNVGKVQGHGGILFVHTSPSNMGKFIKDLGIDVYSVGQSGFIQLKKEHFWHRIIVDLRTGHEPCSFLRLFYICSVGCISTFTFWFVPLHDKLNTRLPFSFITKYQRTFFFTFRSFPFFFSFSNRTLLNYFCLNPCLSLSFYLWSVLINISYVCLPFKVISKTRYGKHEVKTYFRYCLFP